MGMDSAKSQSAFRTIGELSEELGLPQHILRYWETRFPQLRPLQRAGKRRYYRPDDVALVRKIDSLLNQEGYTVKGVQKLLADGKRIEAPSSLVSMPLQRPPAVAAAPSSESVPSPHPGLISIRDRLARALSADDVAARI
jgi:DNA-binding transcriptional MerR regulator